TIRLPVHVAEQVRKMLRSRRILAQKLNRDPLLAEIAKEAGLPERRIQQLLDLVEDPVSLETRVGDGESSFADLIEDEKAEQPAAAAATLQSCPSPSSSTVTATSARPATTARRPSQTAPSSAATRPATARRRSSRRRTSGRSCRSPRSARPRSARPTSASG